MKRALIGIGVAIAVAAFAGGAWAQSQAPSMKIGFGFYAGGKQLDSGKYAVEVTPAGHVVLRAEKGGAVADLTPASSRSAATTMSSSPNSCSTRLAQSDSSPRSGCPARMGIRSVVHQGITSRKLSSVP